MAQDTKAASDTKTVSKPSIVKKILILGLGAVIMTGGAVGTTLYLTGSLSKLAHGEASTASHSEDHDKTPQADKIAPANYVALDPPFVVNFEDQGMLRYLQVGVTVMARDKAVTDAVTNNLPPIRNSLIMLFGSQSFATLASTEGREKLRNQALEEVQSILRKEIGQPGAEAVYFTNFVMQ